MNYGPQVHLYHQLTISCQKTHCVTDIERGKIKMQSGFSAGFPNKVDVLISFLVVS